jgi:2,3-bisphosphoglycerate-independent phosphoglycerate mutase
VERGIKGVRLTIMDNLDLIKQLSITSPTKIVLLVIDGLGGLPHPQTGKSELETASTPNLDRLAKKGSCGLIDPVGMGITPGSSPGHLALFGYDPVRFSVGRGVVETMGIDFELKPKDIAARGNFCTVDKKGLVTDRRAGRISTDKCTELCQRLEGIDIEGVKLFVLPVREHRLAVVFRGEGLAPQVSDSDPQQTGVAPKSVKAQKETARRMADVASEFIEKAKKVLAGQHPANMVLLRGFSQRPDIPTMSEVYKLKPAAIASYPMYRGLAKLVGMKILETGASIKEEMATLNKNYDHHDFFFIHIKGTDSAGEDGDFDRKVSTIEEIDQALPALIDLKPDVMVVTGDHSTPALLKGHSWHPVPVLLHSKYCRPDRVSEFTEQACITGGLGRFPGTQVMPLAMANALKLNKFGA